MSSKLLTMLAITLFVSTQGQAEELPPELPLWKEAPAHYAPGYDATEQVRSVQPPPGSLSGSNRAFSFVSTPTYAIHRPENPNGVGVVICPGGGFRDVWIDREGHDLAIWLKDHNVTSLVLKYRTRLDNGNLAADQWQNYQRAVQADGRQAIRILREQASDLGLRPDKIGICGFSAGGHLATSCSLRTEPELPETRVSAVPDFAGLFYPGIPDEAGQLIENCTTSESAAPPICPMFIVNARVDKLTPADKCIEFYATLLRAGVNAELHVFSRGDHGFGLAVGRGKSTALWPTSFAAWLRDTNIIED